MQTHKPAHDSLVRDIIHTQGLGADDPILEMAVSQLWINPDPEKPGYRIIYIQKHGFQLFTGRSFTHNGEDYRVHFVNDGLLTALFELKAMYKNDYQQHFMSAELFYSSVSDGSGQSMHQLNTRLLLSDFLEPSESLRTTADIVKLGAYNTISFTEPGFSMFDYVTPGIESRYLRILIKRLLANLDADKHPILTYRPLGLFWNKLLSNVECSMIYAALVETQSMPPESNDLWKNHREVLECLTQVLKTAIDQRTHVKLLDMSSSDTPSTVYDIFAKP